MRLSIMLAFILIAFSTQGVEERGLEKKPLFVKGVGGYNIYRIPSLIVTQRGTILAFCEGREAGDSSDIDMLLRRSEDNGRTWSRKLVVWDEGKNVCGNPCPVIDQETGIIWLLMTWNDSRDSDKDLHQGTGRNTRRVYVCHSIDDGLSWSQPVEITQSVKREDWCWYATGPGVGIQLRQEPYQGRLVIPCDHSSEADGYASHAIYSDDRGASWQLGDSVLGGCNECQVVELVDGSLMLNMRLQKDGPGKRGIATSKVGGVTWSKMEPDPTLIDPVCQASLIRYSLASEQGKNRLLFSNPAQTVLPGNQKGDRTRMTVRLSYDEGKTWPVSKLIHEGPSAYSCLAVLPDGDIGCLYEGGDNQYEEITFARFSLSWLTDGKDSNAIFLRQK